MKQVSIRELRQHASVWLREVQAGASFEVTDRGRPVAVLAPLRSADPLDRMIAEGRARPARGDILRHGPPLPPEEGVELPSVTLARMRADER